MTAVRGVTTSAVALPIMSSGAKLPICGSSLNFVTYCKGSGAMNKHAKHIRTIYNEKYVHIGQKFCKKIGEEVGLNQPAKEWCSVGVLAIGYFCDVLDGPFYIVGFDTVEGRKGKFSHYYPSKPSGDAFHNWRKEADYIQKKIDEGKVKILG